MQGTLEERLLLCKLLKDDYRSIGLASEAAVRERLFAPEDELSLAILTVTNRTDIPDEEINRLVSEFEALAEPDSHPMCVFLEGRFVLVCIGRLDMKQLCEQILLRAGETGWQLSGCTTGNVFSNPGDLWRDYSNLSHRMDFIKFCGDPAEPVSVLNFDRNVQGARHQETSTLMIRELNQKLFQCIISYSFELARQSVLELFSLVRTANSVDVDLFKGNLFHILESAAYMIGFKVDKAGQVSELLPVFLQSFNAAETAEEIREQTISVIDFIEHALYAGKNKTEEIDRILHYIDNNYQNQDLSLEAVAGVFHKNPAYLSRQFKAGVNMNFSVYLQNLRLSRAERLLRETDLTVEKIAEMTGWGSVKSLYRVFSQREGISPNRYRTAEQGRNAEES